MVPGMLPSQLEILSIGQTYFGTSMKQVDLNASALQVPHMQWRPNVRLMACCTGSNNSLWTVLYIPSQYLLTLQTLVRIS